MYRVEENEHQFPEIQVYGNWKFILYKLDLKKLSLFLQPVTSLLTLDTLLKQISN